MTMSASVMTYHTSDMYLTLSSWRPAKHVERTHHQLRSRGQVVKPQHKEIVKGLLTYVPIIRSRYLSPPTGGSNSARYCYSVFMRHLVRAREVHEWPVPVPSTVAELGPGDSIGVGIAALLAGANSYTGLDVVRFASLSKNLDIFEELTTLFRERAPIPGPDEFPEIRPLLTSYDFPLLILPEAWLDAALEEARVRMIRDEVKTPGSMIRYVAPWDDEDVIDDGSIDFLISQAVLEHVNDLESTYAGLDRWLAPDGLMSHSIDFRSHGLHEAWNGHLSFAPLVWRVLVGRRRALLNRAQWSQHHAYLQARFRIAQLTLFEREDGLPAGRLWRGFRGSTEDLRTATVFVQATKRNT